MSVRFQDVHGTNLMNVMAATRESITNHEAGRGEQTTSKLVLSHCLPSIVCPCTRFIKPERVKTVSRRPKTAYP
jgi:hypothetical protein